MKGHKLHVTRKMKENRGINDKRDSKDQLTAFCQFTFGIILREEKRTKGRNKASKQRKERKGKEIQGNQRE